MIEYRDNYSKTFGSLWQYCSDKPAVNDNSVIGDFNAANVADSFRSKETITFNIDDKDTKSVEIIVPFKYLSNFWRTLETLPISHEINLILT